MLLLLISTFHFFALTVSLRTTSEDEKCIVGAGNNDYSSSGYTDGGEIFNQR